ncbi:hypothetical protein P0W64_12225 [Tsukamurella sp. 8F]|uniref:hypothetical protein n=1 Tax=unclassified Tsukamurella TaxID=2633480 RepID=UPI0023B8FF0B|nr:MULTISPECIES: hypothetical protein [unclassified Tsukamurella]MDF0531612.1 hypothetical protein [Tsukamurella sp. 8J]MDF0587541.1 hypothetical protein [Tsukamurella sp. 8F]
MPAIEPSVPTGRTVTRRAAIAMAGVSLGALTACSFTPDRSGDPATKTLTNLADAARADAAAATALIATAPSLATTLRLIAEQRTEHARAITDELSRFLEQPAPSPSAAPAPATRTQAKLVSQLKASARAAGDAAVSSSGFRASLLGAVAAAVTTHAEVLLA